MTKQRSDYLPDLLAIADRCNVLIDSGGFTDYWNSIKSAALGKTIKRIQVEDYIKFCHLVKDKVYGYIQLDKPRDPEASKVLLQKQVDAGLNPMPVFVQGMEWEYLPELMKINHKICVSAGWQSNAEYSYQRYQKAYKLTEGKIKSHALAFGRYPQILGLPIASADSSTWLDGGKYGRILIFDKTSGFKGLSRDDVRKSFNTSKVSKVMGVLTNFGITKEDLNDGMQWHINSNKGSITQATHTFAFMQAMKFIKLSSNIDYFIVIPGVSKSTYFGQLCAVLSSIQENGKLDYQMYKREVGRMSTMNDQQFAEYSRKAIGGFQSVK